MTARQRPKSRSHYGPLFLLLGAAIVVWALYAAAVLSFPFTGDFWEARGKFGDMFGAFTALFTGCAFGALVYGIRLEYKAFRRQELHSALSAQLDTLVQLFALPEDQRTPVWRAIVTAPGGPGEKFSMDQAIATQIAALDHLMAGGDLDRVPTYGRPPASDPDHIVG